jgi:hypothetical protein
MHYRILFFLFALSGSIARSQEIFLKGYNYRPTGEFGFVMKSTWSAELGYRTSFEEDKRIRGSFSASYLIMKPRMESFPIYGVLHDGSGDHVLPGSQSFQKYNIAQIFGGMDLAFINKEKLAVFGGFDITIGAASVEYTSKVETLIEESYSGGGILGGFRFRLGTEYEFTEHFGAFVVAERSVWLLAEPAAINWSNNYGIGIKYRFEGK